MAKKSQLSALPLGGVGEIGMNTMIYECNGDMILVDAGIMFPDENAPGTNVVVADIDYIRDNIKRLKAVVITHAHEDHIGAMPYLWEELDAPIYISPFAKYVLDDKLSQKGYDGTKRNITIIREGEIYEINKNFSVEYIGVTHSIPEAFSVAIRTPHGLLMHTGDYKMDPNPVIGEVSNVKRLKEIGDEGVLAMLGDSTNIFNTKHSGSEGDLAEKLEKLMDDVEGRLIFASFASNTYRVLKVCEIAVSHGRKIALMGRTVQKMIQYAKGLGYFPESLKGHIIETDEAAGLPDNKVMIFASGTQGEGNASLTRLANGANVRGIKIKEGDTVLFSSKMIPGNERPILHTLNKLLKLGAKVVNEKTDDVHVSGHGSRPEIKEMYELLRPDYMIPVHGEFAHLQEQHKFAKECGLKSFLITNGDRMIFGPDKPVVKKQVTPTGRDYMDGHSLIRQSDQYILHERRRMSFDGIVMAAFAIDQESREWCSDITLQTKGIMNQETSKELLKTAEDAAVKAMELAFPDNMIDDTLRASEVIRATVRRAISRELGKKPAVVVNVVEV